MWRDSNDRRNSEIEDMIFRLQSQYPTRLPRVNVLNLDKLFVLEWIIHRSNGTPQRNWRYVCCPLFVVEDSALKAGGVEQSTLREYILTPRTDVFSSCVTHRIQFLVLLIFLPASFYEERQFERKQSSRSRHTCQRLTSTAQIQTTHWTTRSSTSTTDCFTSAPRSSAQLTDVNFSRWTICTDGRTVITNFALYRKSALVLSPRLKTHSIS